MKINRTKFLLSANLILIGVLAVTAIIGAATTLTPPGSPGATMKTLEDIYQKVIAGTLAGVHILNPSMGPTGTMHTLTDIYNAVPTNDKVCTGTNAGTANCGITEWSGDLSGGSGDNWDGAAIVCSTWGGRLPTINELAGEISQQFTIGGPYIFSPNTTYWSSSANLSAQVWTLAHDGTTTLYYYYTDTGSSGIQYRCVR